MHPGPPGQLGASRVPKAYLESQIPSPGIPPFFNALTDLGSLSRLHELPESKEATVCKSYRKQVPHETATQILRYRRALLRFIRSRGVAHHDVEDLAQEVLAAVIFSPFRDRGYGVWPYLRMTASKKAQRHLRIKRLRLCPTPNDVLDALPGRPVERIDIEALIHNALAQHEDNPDQVIWLARYRGATLKQLAASFELSIEGARQVALRHSQRIAAYIRSRISWL